KDISVCSITRTVFGKVVTITWTLQLRAIAIQKRSSRTHLRFPASRRLRSTRSPRENFAAHGDLLRDGVLWPAVGSVSRVSLTTKLSGLRKFFENDRTHWATSRVALQL